MNFVVVRACLRARHADFSRTSKKKKTHTHAKNFSLNPVSQSILYLTTLVPSLLTLDSKYKIFFRKIIHYIFKITLSDLRVKLITNVIGEFLKLKIIIINRFTIKQMKFHFRSI